MWAGGPFGAGPIALDRDVLEGERERGVVCPQTGTDGRASKEAVTVATTPHKDVGAGVLSGDATGAAAGNLPRTRPRLLKIGDVSLSAQVIGHGYPLVLMHGGPSLDHYTLLPFRQLADRFTLIFYDHRCNGRLAGAPVSSMTWENLTADAEELRQKLGFDRWAVLGHSFGGMVALEYALRYPASLSHLVLLDTGGDSWWPQHNAAGLLARRGYSPDKVELVRRWENGEFTPQEYIPIALKIREVYGHGSFLRQTVHDAARGQGRPKARPQAWIFVGRQLWKGWTVMDRLGEISVPTLVIAGRDDVFFPPEHQGQLAAGIPRARLQIIERAGHVAYSERPAEVMAAVTDFISADTQIMAGSRDAEPDNQAQETADAQPEISPTPNAAKTGATKQQTLRDHERRPLDQERRLLDKGSHAVDWVRATTAATFWSRLNAIDFMNSSLQFAALTVLCLFPFLIIFSAENKGDARHALIARLGLDQQAAQDVNQLMSSGTRRDDPEHHRGRRRAPRRDRHRLHPAGLVPARL
jgi:proline iminopeptidase